ELSVSPLSSAGRSTTSAPAARAAAAMLSSSVLTVTSSTRRAARAVTTQRTMSGTPPTGWTFLCKIPFEPPRAGITTYAVIPPLSTPVRTPPSPRAHFVRRHAGRSATGGSRTREGEAREPTSVGGDCGTQLGGRAPHAQRVPARTEEARRVLELDDPPLRA